MAGRYYSANFENTALTAGSACTVLQGKAASGHAWRLLAWRLFFEGTTSTNQPVDVTIVRQTTDAASGTAPVVTKKDPSYQESPLTTWAAAVPGSTQPTDCAVANKISTFKGRCHPQGNYGEMIVIDNPTICPGTDSDSAVRLGWKVLAANAVECAGTADYEE